jgi:DNA-binding transcriptional ArsR family regulator
VNGLWLVPRRRSAMDDCRHSFCTEAGAAVGSDDGSISMFSHGDETLGWQLSQHELPPGTSVARIAEFGSIIGDQARIAMLVALLSDEWLSASALADRAGITASTASSHLGKLLSCGLLQVRVDGRRRLHNLASEQSREIIRSLCLASARTPTFRQRDAKDLRPARACSGHLAGRLAIELADRFVDAFAADRPVISKSGHLRLLAFGIAMADLERAKLEFCGDWSERQPHVAGVLGRLLLQRSFQLEWLRRRPSTPGLIVTPAGVEGYRNRFGIRVRS